MAKIFLQITLLVLGFVSSASAYRSIDDGFPPGGPIVRYLSWCEKEAVFREDERGQQTLVHDCAQYGQTCRQLDHIRGPYAYVTAVCVMKSQD
jgi:hypothetical protein